MRLPAVILLVYSCGAIPATSHLWLVGNGQRLPGRQHTFCIDPICIAVGQGGAVAQLLDWLGGFVVNLEDGTGPPPTSLVLLFRHFVHTSSTRRIRPRVVGNGTLEEDWGRQLAGVVGNLWK